MQPSPAPQASAEPAAEITRLAEMIARRRRGLVDEEDFRRLRLQHGVYGIRGQTDVHMLRVKLPAGVLDAAQCERLGEIVDRFGRGMGHLTTRQDIELHWVALEQVPEVLRLLAEVGLTTREACGNVVRNITACPLAGVCTSEVFDVTPYAAAVARHLLRNPICQTLPRKFKIAFSGCATDCVATGIHDVGAVAVVQEEAGIRHLGFRVYVGGGLGPLPRAAQLLEPFTPAEQLILTIESIVRVFDRLGNRENLARARLKFLVAEVGIDAVRQAVLRERRMLWSAWSGEPPQPVAPPGAPGAAEGLRTEAGPRPGGPGGAPSGAGLPGSPGPRRVPLTFGPWHRTNVRPQRQPGYRAVYVTVPGGDLSGRQLRALAELLRRVPGLELRTEIGQNLVLRWVPEAWLPSVYVALAEMGLGEPGAHSIADVVSCPGADTCNLAITYAHRLALELGRRLAERPDLARADDLQGVNIKVSGCTNACGQHHLATIGLYGGVRKVGTRQVPSYELLLGGEVRDGSVTFAQPVMRLPARRVPDAVFRLIEQYRAERLDGESFLAWVRRNQETPPGDDRTPGAPTPARTEPTDETGGVR